MNLQKKIKWIAGLLLLFFVIFATNQIDKSNFLRIKDSVKTIYEDRLLSNHILSEISFLIKEKELAIASGNKSFYNDRNQRVNEQILYHVADFEATKLTENEEQVFLQFKGNLQELYKKENNRSSSDLHNTDLLLQQVNQDLQILSRIQLDEGKRQVNISKKASDNVEFFTQVEFYLLIFLAIIIQVIIIYQPKTDKKETIYMKMNINSKEEDLVSF